MSTQDAWGDYWRGGALTTFGDKPTYQGELRNFWLDFLQSLDDGAVVVDLGAGNGALEEIAQQYCQDTGRAMTVHAVDAAKVSPRITSAGDSPCRITWHPRTRNEETGLPDAGVDAVIGSYAFEYGDDSATVAEIARILKPAGRCRFLMHHAESVLIKDTAGEMAVLDAAFEKNSLFDLAEAFLREFGTIRKVSQFDKLRRSGRADPLLKRLDAAHDHVAAHATTPNGQALLAALSRGISALITPPVLLEARQVLLDRLKLARREYTANRRRLQDMQKAQVDESRMQHIMALFSAQDMQVTAEPFMVSGFSAPAGWAVDIARR